MTISPPSDQQIALAEQAIQHAVHKAEQHFQQTFSKPNLSFKLRGRAAGKAYLLDNQIRLNPVLFVQNEQAFIDDVVPHEVAHLLVFQRYGKVRPHGAEWQFMMEQVLGVPASTRHQFDVSAVSGKTFEYRCGCDVHQLTVRRHNKVLRKQASYRCRQCGQVLVSSI